MPRLLLAASATVVLALGVTGLACESAPSGPTGRSGTCPLPSGTFTETFVDIDAGVSCPPQPAQTLTLDGSQSFLEPAPSSEIPGGVTDCSTDVDTSTCTFTANCTTSVDGGTAQVVFTAVTFDGDTGHGRRSVEPNTCSTDVCVYEVTITKNG